MFKTFVYNVVTSS